MCCSCSLPSHQKNQTHTDTSHLLLLLMLLLWLCRGSARRARRTAGQSVFSKAQEEAEK